MIDTILSKVLISTLHFRNILTMEIGMTLFLFFSSPVGSNHVCMQFFIYLHCHVYTTHSMCRLFTQMGISPFSKFSPTLKLHIYVYRLFQKRSTCR